jgi:hypothetical protein
MTSTEAAEDQTNFNKSCSVASGIKHAAEPKLIHVMYPFYALCGKTTQK